MKLRILASLFVLMLGSVMSVQATDPDNNAVASVSPAAGEQINWQVIGGGGGTASSASYIVSSTIGQTAAGPISSASYAVNQGYWQRFAAGESCCSGTTGNVNESIAELPDLSDLSLLIAYMTVSPRPTLPCLPEANINNASGIDLSDLSLLIAYLTMSPRPVLPNCP